MVYVSGFETGKPELSKGYSYNKFWKTSGLVEVDLSGNKAMVCAILSMEWCI